MARRLDTLLYGLPWLAIQLYILHDYQTADPVSPVLYYAAFVIPFVFVQVFFLSSLAQTLTAFVLEPLFLTLFGTTPGKWIMGLELRNAEGGHLALTQARNRTMTVIFGGEGFYLPIYSLWRNYRSYRAVSYTHLGSDVGAVQVHKLDRLDLAQRANGRYIV